MAPLNIDIAYACLIYAFAITVFLLGIGAFMAFISSWISDRDTDKRMRQ